MLEWISIAVLSLILVFVPIVSRKKSVKLALGRGVTTFDVLDLLSKDIAVAGGVGQISDRRPFWVLLVARLAGWEVENAVVAKGDSKRVDKPPEPRPQGRSAGPTYVLSEPTRPPEYVRDYEGADFVRQDYSGRDLSRANLAGANFQEADLSRANLSGSTLVGAILNGANLSRANLMSALLMRADLSGVDLTWANMSGADLGGALLVNALMDGVTWSNQTTWPEVDRDEIQRRSVRIGPDSWQILPVESGDRVLMG